MLLYLASKYLSSLLSKEMNGSWPLEALKAQAVAARSYALDKMKEYESYENFHKIIHDEIKNINYYDYCNLRKSLYFLDLKSVISTSDLKIKKILSNDF